LWPSYFIPIGYIEYNIRVKSNKNITIDEISQIEAKYKFFYFLRDLGIKSAFQPAVVSWKKYIEIVLDMRIGR
jgi:hypothetical protein